jgi:hypothetical protein
MSTVGRAWFRSALAVTVVAVGTALAPAGPAIAAAKHRPTVKFDAPVCVSDLGVSFNDTVNWKTGSVGTTEVDWGDGDSAVSSYPFWHVYASAGTYPVTLTVTNNEGSGTATTDVTVGSSSATCVYNLSPEPIAEGGTLQSGQSAPVVVKVTNTKNKAVKSPEPVWLSFSPAPDGGSATACCTASGSSAPLSTTPVALTTGVDEPAGEVAITYTASSTPPDSGSDVITAAGVPDADDSQSASTSYQYSSTPEPLAPPSSIASDCSADVSKSLGQWLRDLPANATVEPSSGACYQVDEGLSLNFPSGLTIDGGTYENLSTAPSGSKGGGTQRGDPVFDVLGGSNLTLENMTIEGVNPGGYLAKMAFASGIELQGTGDATISNVTITDTYGDGITLDPLRNDADHKGPKILSATDNATITDVTIDGAGRMGISFVSVLGAMVNTVEVSNVGLDAFDVEADQSNEGAENVTIDGCTASNPENSNLERAFFSNGGASAGDQTGTITVENCSMDMAQGNTALEIFRPDKGTNLRGPFTFDDDVFYCGPGTTSSSSSGAGCVEVGGGTVTVSNSTFYYSSTAPYENVYELFSGSTLTFSGDTAAGFGGCGASTPTGTVDSTSTFDGDGEGTWPPPSC